MKSEKLLKILLVLEVFLLIGLLLFMGISKGNIGTSPQYEGFSNKIKIFFERAKGEVVLDLPKQENKKIKVKQKKDTQVPKYSYEELKQIVISSLDYHGAKPVYTQQIYEKVCNFDKNICNKVVFYNTDFNKKVEYLAIIQFVIASIDRNLQYPVKIRDVLKNIQVDSYATRRGYAGHNLILINAGSIKSNKEFLNVLTHELGHIIDLGVLKGQSYKKDMRYTEFGKARFSVDDPSIRFYKISWVGENIRRAGHTFKEFVSGYGMTDPFEDFAESFNMYMNHYLYFKYLSLNNLTLQQKFDFIDSLMNGFHFFDDKPALAKVKSVPSRRPRDSTIMK